MPPRRPFQRLKNLLIYVVIRGAVALAAALLPLGAARALGRALGALGWRVARRERARARAAATAVLGAAPGEAAARASFVGLGEAAGEAVKLDALARDFDRAGTTGPVRLDAADARVLEDALAEGRGVVYVTAHLGNWELMAAYLAWRGFPIWTVARASYDPRLTALIDGWRRRHGVHAILRGAGAGGATDAGVVRRCLKALRARRVLGLLLDQDLGDAPHVVAPFLGRAARVATGPAELALRSSAPVVAGFATRAAPGVHRLRIERLAVCPGPGRHGDAAALARRMSAAIEAAILGSPSDWVWLHDRWRGVPGPGKAGGTAPPRLGVNPQSKPRARSSPLALHP
ncbi:MAG TPA: lysophospholipid acyltransferase family protein [Myxococcota bacterium]|nr:lysophospholipid acyltransferase family protein [Myxococcota bacterium]